MKPLGRCGPLRHDDDFARVVHSRRSYAPLPLALSLLAVLGCARADSPPAPAAAVELSPDVQNAEASYGSVALFPLNATEVLQLSHVSATVTHVNVVTGTTRVVARQGSGPTELQFPIGFAPDSGHQWPRVIDLGRRRLVAIDRTLRDRETTLAMSGRADIVSLLAQVPVAGASFGDVRELVLRPDSALFYPRAMRYASVLSVETSTRGDTLVRLRPALDHINAAGTYVANAPLGCTTGDGALLVLDPAAGAVRHFVTSAERAPLRLDSAFRAAAARPLADAERRQLLRHILRQALINEREPASDVTVDSLVQETVRSGYIDRLIGTARPLAASFVCDISGGYVLVEEFAAEREGTGHTGRWLLMPLHAGRERLAFRVPGNVSILAARHEHLWGVIRDDTDLEYVVRLRLPDPRVAQRAGSEHGR